MGPHLPKYWYGCIGDSPLSPFNVCDCCIYSGHCLYENRFAVGCSAPEGRSNSYVHYRQNPPAIKRILERRDREIAAFVASFRRVKPEMIAFNPFGEVSYAMQKRTAQRLRTYGWRQAVDELTWWRKCANCGGLFKTCNDERLFCNDCHEEVCERLKYSPLYQETKKSVDDRHLSMRVYRALCNR